MNYYESCTKPFTDHFPYQVIYSSGVTLQSTLRTKPFAKIVKTNCAQPFPSLNMFRSLPEMKSFLLSTFTESFKWFI